MARRSLRVSFTNFFSSTRRRLPARIASPSRTLRSSVFPRCATFARSRSAPTSLWKPTCTTFCVDLFRRHGHPFCQVVFCSLSRDSAYLQEEGAVCAALQSYSWPISVLGHWLWPPKNTTTSSRQKKEDLST